MGTTEEEDDLWGQVAALIIIFFIFVFVFLRVTGRLVVVWVSHNGADGQKVRTTQLCSNASC